MPLRRDASVLSSSLRDAPVSTNMQNAVYSTSSEHLATGAMVTAMMSVQTAMLPKLATCSSSSSPQDHNMPGAAGTRNKRLCRPLLAAPVGNLCVLSHMCTSMRTQHCSAPSACCISLLCSQDASNYKTEENDQKDNGMKGQLNA